MQKKQDMGWLFFAIPIVATVLSVPYLQVFQPALWQSIIQFWHTTPSWVVWMGWMTSGFLGLLIAAGFKGVGYVMLVLGRSAFGFSYHGDAGYVFFLYSLATIGGILLAVVLGPILLALSFGLRKGLRKRGRRNDAV